MNYYLLSSCFSKTAEEKKTLFPLKIYRFVQTVCLIAAPAINKFCYLDRLVKIRSKNTTLALNSNFSIISVFDGYFAAGKMVEDENFAY